ncbi:Hemolysin, contains CBS domains [Caminicella sporogenes DSM 14501]|uniref:Hemolysin, contains CBS domains n=1 Tax=Caminicella sporogenes DSM 14501 TaxID=1121266 RepID=A0A1M6MBF2_9FIRM|nr:hemolysin family protein [Caminicella sporogenes]RKD27619.1 hemolysin [Caminicella sporogenes]SHJ80764.1 Hemolysin, contains CBS domains [Caminicella sporogenes DSM 14501]
MDINIFVRLVLLIVLLSLSGIFSSAETSLSSLNIVNVKRLKRKGIREAQILEKLLKNSSKTLATILIGNNIANIAATAIATELTLMIFTGREATFIVTIIMTVLVLVFGEITPKTYAAYNPEKMAVKLAGLIDFLSIVFTPVLFVLNKITKVIIRIFGGNVASNRTVVSEEEIKTLVDVGEEMGIIEKQEREMINSIFEIGDIYVTDVMVPRIDMIYLEEKATIKDAIKYVLEHGYSRIPVISDSVDNIIGIIYAKDLLSCYFDEKNIEDLTIKDLIRPAYFIPQSKKAIDLLTEMQIKKVHIAIVLDEYGGTMGLVTIEDILEEIVGDILDEYDKEIDLIDYVDENTLIVDSKVSIEEINRIFSINLPDDEFDSIGGFVFNLIGKVPNINDTIRYEDISFKVLDIHNRRIKKVQIKRVDKGDK